jgi:hypothetical protein
LYVSDVDAGLDLKTPMLEPKISSIQCKKLAKT